MQNIKVAIIDNGVANDLTLLDNNVYIDNENHCIVNSDKIEYSGFMHGTICTLILQNEFSICTISSVKILNQDGIGKVEKLKPALEWCYQNHIFLVNLSFGTTNFQEKPVIRNIINHYANRGMIIVAATSNNGLQTYPSLFSNVIGVIAGDRMFKDEHLYMNIGVDFVAPSEHIIKMGNMYVKLEKSNSYAVPFVTAKIGALEQDLKNFNICSVKYKLLNWNNKIFRPFIPDWIEYAWVSQKIKSSSASYYFKIIGKDYFYNEKQIDTIVINDKEDYYIYKNAGKHLVYLGEEYIEHLDENKYFWSRKQRILQICMSEHRIKDIDVPVILLNLDEKQDEILWLSKLEECFEKDGYNAYTVSQIVESVLYDLEYIPKELCNSNDNEKLHDFLYWQIYYGQVDIVIWGINKYQYLKKTDTLVDILIDISGTDTNCGITLYYAEQLKKQKIFTEINIDKIGILYHYILKILMEDENEQ